MKGSDGGHGESGAGETSGSGPGVSVGIGVGAGALGGGPSQAGACCPGAAPPPHSMAELSATHAALAYAASWPSRETLQIEQNSAITAATIVSAAARGGERRRRAGARMPGALAGYAVVHGGRISMAELSSF